MEFFSLKRPCLIRNVDPSPERLPALSSAVTERVTAFPSAYSRSALIVPSFVTVAGLFSVAVVTSVILLADVVPKESSKTFEVSEAEVFP